MNYKTLINNLLLFTLLVLIILSCGGQDQSTFIDLEESEKIIRYRSMLDHSDSLLGIKDYKSARDVLAIALELSREVNDSLILAAIWNNVGYMNMKTSNYDSSISNYLVSIKISKATGNRKREASTLKNLGITYSSIGLKQVAISYYREALLIVEALRDSNQIASINSSIGNLYNDLKNYEEAFKHNSQSLAMWASIGRKDKLQIGLSNVGNALLGLDRVDEAIEHYQRALTIKRKGKDKYSLAITLNNIGEAYLKQQKFKLALNVLLESLTIRNELDRVANNPIVLNNLANLEMQQSNLKQASLWLKKSSIAIDKFPLKDNKLEFLRLMKMFLEMSQEYKKALEVDKAYDSLKQSSFDKEIVGVNKRQFEYDLDRKESEKELFKARYEAAKTEKEAETLRANVQMYSLIIIVLITIIISYFAYKLRKQNRHIENLIRELHHRVKNHLGMISGMFGAQSLEASGNAELLEEARARVEAVNGIHRRLYRQDEYEYVNMQEYLTELVDNSALVFGVLGSLEKQLDIENEPLEIDKAISVGLIANEVLTNAFKYGLQQTNQPVLKIVLEKAIKGYRMLIYNNANPNTNPVTDSTGFGSELIKRLTANLKGESHTTEQNGFHFELTFP